MKYKIIDLNSYPRKDTFLHFKNETNCVYSLTIKINVKKVYEKSKEIGIGFYSLFMSVLTKSLDAYDFTRMSIKDDELIVYDHVIPCFTLFHEDTGTYSCLNVEYIDDLVEYAKAMDEHIKRNRDNHDFIINPMPNHGYPVSSVPWFSYDNLTIKVFDVKNNLLPMITWGRFEKTNFMMPISFEINHAAMDGYHTYLFIEKLKETIDNL